MVGLAASFVVYWNAFNLNVGFVRSLPGVFHTFMVYAHLFGIVILTDYCWSGEVKKSLRNFRWPDSDGLPG